MFKRDSLVPLLGISSESFTHLAPSGKLELELELELGAGWSPPEPA